VPNTHLAGRKLCTQMRPKEIAILVKTQALRYIALMPQEIPSPFKPGTIVKWVRPTDADDAAVRYEVLDSYDGRAHIRVLAQCMPNWNPNLLPIATVSVEDIEVV
jgi:hypothetical protein